MSHVPARASVSDLRSAENTLSQLARKCCLLGTNPIFALSTRHKSVMLHVLVDIPITRLRAEVIALRRLALLSLLETRVFSI